MSNPPIRLALAMLLLVALMAACSRQTRLDPAWSPPEKFALSQDALVSSFGVSQIDGRPVCIDGSDYYFLGSDGTNWTKKTFLAPVNPANSFLLTDPMGARLILCNGEVTGARLGSPIDGKLEATFAFCSLDPASGISGGAVRHVTLTANDLFGEIKRTGDVQPVEPIWRKMYGPPVISPAMGGLGTGVISGGDIYIPYMVECSAFYGSQKEATGSGPWQAGLLHSSGDYSHWTTIKLLDVYTLGLGAVATPDNLYCFYQRLGEKDPKVWGLWSVRMPRAQAASSVPELIAPTYCRTTSATYSTATDGGKIHLIWLDDRHETYSTLRSLQTGGGPSGATRYEVYYRSRKDDESGWTKEVCLSKGQKFAFAPVMAVEGGRIIVAWEGYQKGWGQHCPGDIYYTTSRDGGTTWTAVTRATDNATSGWVSGAPQVILYEGMIHLFYIRGKVKENYVGAGLRLLNQPPWDILYQHRPFPGE